MTKTFCSSGSSVVEGVQGMKGEKEPPIHWHVLHNCRSGRKVVLSSGMTAAVTSHDVLNLTATYTMLEAVEGVKRLVRHTQDAADKSEAMSVLEGSQEHTPGTHSPAGVVHEVQNSTGMSLECWLAPPSQPTRGGKQASSPCSLLKPPVLRLTWAMLAQ